MKSGRRDALKNIAIAGISTISLPYSVSALWEQQMISRKIPSSGELIPVVGLGTWQSFDVGSRQGDRQQLKQVLTLMHRYGGKVIDSSPMYGSSEEVAGDLTAELPFRNHFFYATKVWTSGKSSGVSQMKSSMKKMRREKMDLMQIHNLLDWQTHLKTLQEWKEKGKIRYIGITHYTDSSQAQLAQIIEAHRIDFVQCNYSILSTNAENKLLPLAQAKGVAVLVNRPYEGGSLFRLTRDRQLPPWAGEAEIKSWGQFFLKYILSNPAVTCVIPGTSKPHHLEDNMRAGFGSLPDQKLRQRMRAFINEI